MLVYILLFSGDFPHCSENAAYLPSRFGPLKLNRYEMTSGSAHFGN